MDMFQILFTILGAAFSIISSLLIYIWNKTYSEHKEEKKKLYNSLLSLESKLIEINRSQSETGMKMSGLIAELKVLSKETSKIEVNLDKFANSISNMDIRLSRIEEWRSMIAEEIESLKDIVSKK